MIQRNPATSLFCLLLAIGLLDLLLLISGYRVLIGEERGEEWTPYSKYTVPIKLNDTLDEPAFIKRPNVSQCGGAWNAAD